ncbi:hypothetical protein ACMFWY_19935 [Roseiconus sp. JC912]|uniref:hypothetical protein n=2 Tax=Pirellulaceae TaxID=2691357 RepID=UPI003A4C6245
MVQVTEEGASSAAPLDAPQQRLATTKVYGSQPSENRSMLSRAKEMITGKRATPPQDVVVAESKTPDQLSNTAMQQTAATTTRQSLARDSAVRNQTRASVAANRSPVQETETTTVRPVSANDDEIKVTIGGLVSASLTDLSVEESGVKAPVEVAEPPVVASHPTPPVKTEDAAKVAVASETPKVRRRPISQTGQPLALAAALEDSLDSLPKLPSSAGEYDGPGPKRIGVGKPSITSSADTKTAAYAYVGDDEPMAPAPDSVQTVSHASNQQTSATLVGSPSETVGPAKELTEDELYSKLLERIVEPKVGETPLDLERRQVIARYLMVLAGDPETAIESMDGFNESEREFLKNQLVGLWTMIDPDGHPSSGQRVNEALPRFRAAAAYLSEATESLELRHLEFCTEIESYGQVKPFEGNRFAPGQQVILYCEVENFSVVDQGGLFQTSLEGSYEIFDASGNKVVSQLLPTDQQRSRNRLRDYFVAYQMNLPDQLRKGTYRLQLTLEDALGKKVGQANIPFEIR